MRKTLQATDEFLFEQTARLVERLIKTTREFGYPPTLVAQAMLGAALAELANTQGSNAVVEMLQDLAQQLSQAGQAVRHQ